MHARGPATAGDDGPAGATEPMLAECGELLRQAGATCEELSRLERELRGASHADLQEFAGYLRRHAPAASAKIVEDLRFDSQYELGPDSEPQLGVPEGKITEFALSGSKNYPDASHQWWLYVPARYSRKESIALMVFMDGGSYVARDGAWRVPVVLDNLIAKTELPMMAAVFINPSPGESLRATNGPDGTPYLDTSHRSLEYDTTDDRYARFLLEDVFPKVREHVLIVDNPEGRGLAGHSSGGICAFTAAWQRPDQFRKVHCANGSFTNKRGGHLCPDWVRRSERKPLRVWQQSGAHDLMHPTWGSWAAANETMAAALSEKGYDHRFVFGQGSHGRAHAASVFPDAMRWLWRDYLR